MKVKINIPENLHDITLGQYQRYMDIYDRESENLEFLNIKMVEIFCNVKINDIRAISVTDYESILVDITEAFKAKTPFQKTFKHGGKEFGFVPDLENISLGEYIDLESYMGDVKNFHKAMAVLYRPVTYKGGDHYLIEEYESADKYEGMMKSAPLDVYLGAQVFFFNLGRGLSRHILASSGVMDQDSQLLRILEENGVGTQAFMHLLEGNFGDSIPSLN